MTSTEAENTASASHQKTDRRKFFSSVQVMRGIAALVVALAHSLLGFLPESFEAVLDGSVAVTVFFVISGFVLPLSLGQRYQYHHFGKFWLKRFLRVEPTYLVSCVLAATILIAKTRLAPNGEPWSPTLGQTGAHLLYAIPFTGYRWFSEVYWTLAIEFQFYLILAASFPLVRPALRSIFGTVAIVIAFALATFLDSWAPAFQLFKHAPFFAMGIAMYACHAHERSTIRFLCPMVAAASVIAFLGDHDLKNVLFGAAAAIIALEWKPNLPKLDSLGNVSYSLYVVHYPIAMLAKPACKMLTGSESLGLLFGVAAFLTSFALTIAMYYGVEKPTQILSKRVRYE